LATPSRSAASILASTASSGCRKSTVKNTRPGITLREFGYTCIMPTVAQANGA